MTVSVYLKKWQTKILPLQGKVPLPEHIAFRELLGRMG